MLQLLVKLKKKTNNERKIEANGDKVSPLALAFARRLPTRIKVENIRDISSNISCQSCSCGARSATSGAWEHKIGFNLPISTRGKILRHEGAFQQSEAFDSDVTYPELISNCAHF